MAGHSKWDNIKRRKQREDARRGQVFTKVSRQITIAARDGGPDPNHNFRLRLAIEQARSVNMPNESIERAIRRGIGDVEGAKYEEIVYEGYGPGGMAVLIEIMTDNRNRTASDVRHIFSKYGGNLGESGCVSWMFEKRGIIEIGGAGADEESVLAAALEAGADDVEVEEGSFVVLTAPESFEPVRARLEEDGFSIQRAEVTMRPSTTVELSEEDTRRALQLLEALDDHSDVQQVYANL